MEKWQIFYLVLLTAGFIVGWKTIPILGVVFIWVIIIVSEIIRAIKEIREFEIETPES